MSIPVPSSATTSPTETLTLNYEKVEVVYTSIDGGDSLILRKRPGRSK